jgi:hypothetical protein
MSFIGASAISVTVTPVGETLRGSTVTCAKAGVAKRIRASAKCPVLVLKLFPSLVCNIDRNVSNHFSAFYRTKADPHLYPAFCFKIHESAVYCIAL